MLLNLVACLVALKSVQFYCENYTYYLYNVIKFGTFAVGFKIYTIMSHIIKHM